MATYLLQKKWFCSIIWLIIGAQFTDNNHKKCFCFCYSGTEFAFLFSHCFISLKARMPCKRNISLWSPEVFRYIWSCLKVPSSLQSVQCITYLYHLMTCQFCSLLASQKARFYKAVQYLNHLMCLINFCSLLIY